MEYENEIDLLQLMQRIKKHWLMILLVTVVCGAAGLAYEKITYIPTYRVTSQIAITQKEFVGGDIHQQLLEHVEEEEEVFSRKMSILQKAQEEEKNRQDLAYKRIAENAEQLLLSDEAMQIVIDELETNTTAGALRQRISVKANDKDQRYSSLFQIIVSGNALEETKQLNDVYLSNVVQILQAGKEMDVVEANVLSTSHSHSTESMKVPVLTAVLGFIVSIAPILFQAIPGDLVRSQSTVARSLGLPVLVTIPQIQHRS